LAEASGERVGGGDEVRTAHRLHLVRLAISSRRSVDLSRRDGPGHFTYVEDISRVNRIGADAHRQRPLRADRLCRM